MARLGKIVVAVLACALLAGSVSAQQASKDDVKSALEMVKQMTIMQLNLSEAQQDQLAGICKNFIQSCKLTIASSDTDLNKVAKVQSAASESIKSAMGVLDDQQKSAALALGMSLLNQHSAGTTFPVNGVDIKNLLIRTGLSADKADAIVALAKAHGEAAKKIYADQSLSEDAVKSKIEALRKDTLTSILGKLDPEEQQVMSAVLRAMKQTEKTFMSCLNEEQKPKAVALGNMLLRFMEETLAVK